MPKITTGNVLMGGAGFAAVTAFWGHIKGLFERFKSIFIVSSGLTGPAKRVVSFYLWKNFKCTRFGNKNYVAHNTYVKKNKDYRKVFFETISSSLTFFKGWRPVFISGDDDGEGISIHFIRGTFHIDQFLLEAAIEFDEYEKSSEEEHSRYFIRHHFGSYGVDGGENLPGKSSYDAVEQGPTEGLRPIGTDWDNLGPITIKYPFSFLFYPEKINSFINYLDKWLKSKDWYKDRGLPWRTGALLKGPPGTGKSSFVRAVGQRLDLPIEIYDLVSMSNEELVGFWRQSLNRAPCIVLIEDIDRVFDGDKLIKQSDFSGKGKLTMDCLLNTISGVESADGILVFVTANDATKLDEALGVPDEKGVSSRPGRLDKIVEFGHMPEHCRKAMAQKILSDCTHLIAETVKAGDGEMGAQFEKRCSDIALKEYWKTK